jgi:hypothetical protein
VSDNLKFLANGLRPLLIELRKAQTDAAADPQATISPARLGRWIGAIEAVLEKAGQGSDDATIAANDLNASNDE